MQNKYKGGGACPLYIRDIINFGWLTTSRINLITIPGASNTSIQLNELRSSSGIVLCEVKFPAINPPGSNESFFIANHQPSNLYDGIYAGNGLLIWHDKTNYSIITKDLECAIASGAHGFDHLDNNLDRQGLAADFFNFNNKSQFTPWTNPSTENGIPWSSTHTNTGVAITNISASCSIMTFDFIVDFRSGTITENSWWKSKLELNGDFLIDNNAILSIECDTVVLNGNILKIVNG